MTELTRLNASRATLDEVLAIIDQDAAVILESALATRRVDAILDEIAPYVEALNMLVIVASAINADVLVVDATDVDAKIA